MDSVLRRFRYAFRQIGRTPGLALTIVLTLAMAIGAGTAIFSFVNGLLIRPFPFHDAEQLVQIHAMRGGQQGTMSMAEVLELKEYVSSIESIAAHTASAGGYNYSGQGRPEEWKAILITGNLFEVLGVPYAAGGAWPGAADRDRDYRVILTHGVWQRAFGGAADTVGNKIALDHAAGYQIHGILPHGFDYPRGVEVYRSIGGFTSYDKRDVRNVYAVARMKAGRSIGQLQQELDAVSGRLAEQFPEANAGLSFQAVALRDVHSGDVRPYLLVLMGAFGFVLLIACTNVANLLLVRALSRDRETAVRVALGAGRGEIAGQFLTESLVLALLAAAAGLGAAWWWMNLIRSIIGAQLPDWMVIEMDGRVLGFAVAVSIAASLLVALAPVVHFWRQDRIGETLKEGGRGSSGSRTTGRLRDWMIAGEVAMAVVLLSGAGLLIRTFVSLQSQDKGFDEQRISTFRVALGWKRYQGDSIARYYERAQELLRQVPGIEAVAFAPSPPLSRQQEWAPQTVQTGTQSLQEALQNPYVNFQSISENYLETMRIPVVAGRGFTDFDRKDGEQVAVVSQRLAELLWPGKDPVGERILYNPTAQEPGPWRRVVGVAGNVQHRQLGGETGLDFYVPYRQLPAANQYLLVRHGLTEREFVERVEQTMWSIDPEQSVFDFAPYSQRILDGVWQLRVSRLLLVLFGAVALALAAAGIYGVMSYMVGQRKREFGIRFALGATPSAVQGMVVKHGLVVAGVGMAAGALGAFALGRILANQLHGVSGVDVLSVAGAILALFLVAALASSLPAWRASRLHPVDALRDQ